MFWTKLNESTRTLLYCVTVTGLLVTGLIYVAQTNAVEASPQAAPAVQSTSVVLVPTATFPGTGLGAIPDGTAGGTVCGDFAAPRNVTFNVTGMAAPLSDVRVSFTIGSPVHTWLGDLDVNLRAPADAATATVFKQTGAAAATDCGSSSDVAGPYNFFDTAPAAPTWWGAAAGTPVPSGSYRVSTPGGAAGGGVNALLTPPFAALTTGQINGTWTLRFSDGGEGDTGNVTAATLTLTGGAPPASDAAVDFDGDGKSDYAIIRVGAGPTGQAIWVINPSSGGGLTAYAWGLASDFFCPEDFDGDHKDDIAIWRPGAATQAAFYILNSATSTARIEAFGQTGDDPSVVGDYDNDGKADLAVYRVGDTPSLPSSWYYRTTAGGPVTVYNWGVGGDTAAPGDYNGDGKNDFAISRVTGSDSVFWIAQNGSTNVTVAPFGLASDLITPGDYDGDGKTDIAVARGAVGTGIVLVLEAKQRRADQQVPFGTFNTDYTVQGDYDGDGKTDQAIWRQTDGTFWVRNVATGVVSTFQFGANGDYPVANFTTH